MKTNKVFVVSIIICLLTMVLPTGISESVNEIENIKSVNDFPPENGPYYVSIFGDLQGCHYPSLFHIGPIWFLPNWEYIELTFKDDVMLWVDGEDYIVNSTITIYGLKGFCPLGPLWTISSVYFNGNILVLGTCTSIET